MFTTQTWLAGQGPKLTADEQTEQLFIQGLMARFTDLTSSESNIIQEMLDMEPAERLFLAEDWAKNHTSWSE